MFLQEGPPERSAQAKSVFALENPVKDPHPESISAAETEETIKERRFI
jgi:hypothetical protein